MVFSAHTLSSSPALIRRPFWASTQTTESLREKPSNSGGEKIRAAGRPTVRTDGPSSARLDSATAGRPASACLDSSTGHRGGRRKVDGKGFHKLCFRQEAECSRANSRVYVGSREAAGAAPIQRSSASDDGRIAFSSTERAVCEETCSGDEDGNGCKPERKAERTRLCTLRVRGERRVWASMDANRALPSLPERGGLLFERRRFRDATEVQRRVENKELRARGEQA